MKTMNIIWVNSIRFGWREKIVFPSNLVLGNGLKNEHNLLGGKKVVSKVYHVGTINVCHKMLSTGISFFLILGWENVPNVLKKITYLKIPDVYSARGHWIKKERHKFPHNILLIFYPHFLPQNWKNSIFFCIPNPIKIIVDIKLVTSVIWNSPFISFEVSFLGNHITWDQSSSVIWFPKTLSQRKIWKDYFISHELTSVISDICQVVFHRSLIWIHCQIEITLQCDLEKVWLENPSHMHTQILYPHK